MTPVRAIPEIHVADVGQRPSDSWCALEQKSGKRMKVRIERKNKLISLVAGLQTKKVHYMSNTRGRVSTGPHPGPR
jgi:hypothetical protein